MKINAKCYIAVKYPIYGKIAFNEMTEDEFTWLLNLIVSMRDNGIIQDYQLEAIEL